ncbi:hypothetical protein HD554DRAFT_1979633, partial [Boletus coccyginus]
IVLERLESVYKSCNLVASLCVHASPRGKQPVAIVIPLELNLRHTLTQRSPPGIDSTASLADLCRDQAALVPKAYNMIGKENDFKPVEMLDGVIQTPKSGLVRAAQKVQWNKIARLFEQEL